MSKFLTSFIVSLTVSALLTAVAAPLFVPMPMTTRSKIVTSTNTLTLLNAQPIATQEVATNIETSANINEPRLEALQPSVSSISNRLTNIDTKLMLMKESFVVQDTLPPPPAPSQKPSMDRIEQLRKKVENVEKPRKGDPNRLHDDGVSYGKNGVTYWAVDAVKEAKLLDPTTKIDLLNEWENRKVARLYLRLCLMRANGNEVHALSIYHTDRVCEDGLKYADLVLSQN